MTGNTWYTVRVKYTRQMTNGTFKRVTEPYLLAAVSFTDAEARIYEELGTTIRGEFLVLSIARTDIHDIFAYDDADVWYKGVVSYDKFDDEGGNKKKIKNTFLIGAESVKEANDRLVESLSTLMIDYTIDGVVVTPLVDIFPFVEAEDTNQITQAGGDFKELDTPYSSPKGVVMDLVSDEEGQNPTLKVSPSAETVWRSIPHTVGKISDEDVPTPHHTKEQD